MTTTPKQMTLEQVRNHLRVMANELSKPPELPVTVKTLETLANAIDAELAKQRNAEPVAWVRPIVAMFDSEGVDAGEVVDLQFHTHSWPPEGKGWKPVYLHPHQHNAAEVTDEYGEPVTQIIDKLLSELSNAIEDVEAGKHKSSVLAFLNLAKEYGHAARDVICAIDDARQENKF